MKPTILRSRRLWFFLVIALFFALIYTPTEGNEVDHQECNVVLKFKEIL